MIIHPITSRLEKGGLRLAARIEFAKSQPDLPEILWFRFPESQSHLVSGRADGFAAALVYTALARGEDIHVRGALSPRLAYGLNEFQHLQSVRNPKRYKPIQVYADQYTVAEAREQKNACTFSGGVDSFYTVWLHNPQNEKIPGNELSYALFVQGFDIGLDDANSFQACATAYRSALADLGIELLTASTNARNFDKPGNWATAHGTALIGIGHLLGCGLGRFYVPANNTYSNYPSGTVRSLQEPLLSSESLQFIIDGADTTKFDKIMALGSVPATYDHLRVCYVKPDGLQNCGQCGKCLNTMVSLELCGMLKNYTTFALPLERARVRESRMGYNGLHIHLETIKHALARRRYDLVFDMFVEMAWNSSRWGRTWFVQKLGLR